MSVLLRDSSVRAGADLDGGIRVEAAIASSVAESGAIRQALTGRGKVSEAVRKFLSTKNLASRHLLLQGEILRCAQCASLRMTSSTALRSASKYQSETWATALRHALGPLALRLGEIERVAVGVGEIREKDLAVVAHRAGKFHALGFHLVDAIVNRIPHFDAQLD